jgi:hypothetical protein
MLKVNKVLPGHKFVANFLDAPVRIGMVYRMDDKQFIPALHFNDVFPKIKLKKFTDSGSPGSIQFSEAKEVSISFGGSGATGLGRSEIKLAFKRKRSVAGVIKDAIVDSLRFQNVIEELRQLWSDKAFDKFAREYIFVYEVVHAASGTLVYSEESRNQVVLKHTLDEPVTSLAALGSGDFEFVSNSKRTLEIIRNTAHKPLFKAFLLRRNGEPEILG